MGEFFYGWEGRKEGRKEGRTMAKTNGQNNTMGIFTDKCLFL
jgi:hypothetical protein